MSQFCIILARVRVIVDPELQVVDRYHLTA